MHTEKLTEIKAIVARIADIQGARKLSDNQLLREYPDIGSTKTWRNRLVPGTLEGLNLDRMLAKLQRVAAILDGGSPDEIFYPEMGFAKEMTARLLRLERQTNDRRILACLAPNGTGKSAFARWAVAQSRATRAYVRMRPTWRNRSIHICSGIGRALGKTIQSTNPSDVEHAVIEELANTPRTLFIDQAHEGGVQLMHELRAFVDETPSRFVYLAYDTAFKRVQTGTTDALIEAHAFLGRCLKPPFDLYRGGIAQADAVFYLETAGGLTRSQAESVASRILPVLRASTNLRLLDDAIASAEAAADSAANKKPMAELIIQETVALAGASGEAVKVEEEE